MQCGITWIQPSAAPAAACAGCCACLPCEAVPRAPDTIPRAWEHPTHPTCVTPGPRSAPALGAGDAGSASVPRGEDGGKGLAGEAPAGAPGRLSPFFPAPCFAAPVSSPVCAAEAAAPVALPGVADSLLCCPLGAQSTPARGWTLRRVPRPPSDRHSLSACQRPSSHQLRALGLGKHLSRCRKGPRGETFSLFPFFAGHRRAGVPHPPFHPKEHPPRSHPSRETPPLRAAPPHCLPQGHGSTQTTPEHPELVLSRPARCPWMP